MSDGFTRLEAIEGLVRSEPLNRNFSALDSEIGYTAGYISGDTEIHRNSDGVVTGVTTPVSEISIKYDGEMVDKITEEFRNRTVETMVNYGEDGEVVSTFKEVTEK